MSAHVAVVGGGISGLTSALTLQDLGYAVTLFESRDRPGGVIHTERVDGMLFEGGPDSVLSVKPAIFDLLDRLNLRDRVISTRADGGGTFILRSGDLVPLPQGLSMMVPADLGEMVRTPLFSPAGKLRMALEYFVPARRDDIDESVGDFVRRRLGREALEYLAEPLLGGIYAGDVDQLSLAATYPRLREAERIHGGVVRSVRASRRSGGATAPVSSRSPHSPFVSLAGGLGELVDGMVSALAPSDIRTGTPVSSIELEGHRYRLTVAGGHQQTFDAVVLAVPAPAAAYLLEPLHAELSAVLREIPCVSPVNVSIAFDERDIGKNVAGRGFVIPRAEGRLLTAVTWSSNKFAGRAPAGIAVLKTSLGKAGRLAATEQSDEDVISTVLGELRDILGIDATPIDGRVYRWKHGIPQYTVGHHDRISRIAALAKDLPSLTLVGSAYDGVGIPDCIRRASEQIQVLADRLDTLVPRINPIVA